MVSRLVVNRATKHNQPRFLYIHDLAATGVVRLRKVSTQGNNTDLHTEFLPAERLRNLCELHDVRSPVVHNNIHALMPDDNHIQLAHHDRMNKLRGHLMRHATRYMVIIRIQLLLVRYVSLHARSRSQFALRPKGIAAHLLQLLSA